MNVDPTTTGLVGGAIVGLSTMGKNLVEKALGPVAKEVGKHLQGKVHGYLERNRTVVANQAAQMIEDAGKAPHEVPLRTMLPLLEGASREDNDELRSAWAALLANAATTDDPDGMSPIYANILSQLSPVAARALQRIAAKTTTVTATDNFTLGLVGLILLFPESAEYTSGLSSLIGSITDQLQREGVVLKYVPGRGRWSTLPYPLGEQPVDVEVRITDLGKAFVRACTPPSAVT